MYDTKIVYMNGRWQVYDFLQICIKEFCVTPGWRGEYLREIKWSKST